MAVLQQRPDTSPLRKYLVGYTWNLTRDLARRNIRSKHRATVLAHVKYSKKETFLNNSYIIRCRLKRTRIKNRFSYEKCVCACVLA